MVNSADFKTLLSTPLVAGQDTTVIHRDRDSVTGFSLVASAGADTGMLVASSAAMTAGNAIIGAWDQLDVYYNTEIDLLFLREGAAAGPSGKTILYAFLDYSFFVRDQSAFLKVVPV